MKTKLKTVLLAVGVLAGTASVAQAADGTVSAYVPLSGNAFLLNAIGAVFIGTTLSRQGRANVPGTLLGVLFINVIANGLLLIGRNLPLPVRKASRCASCSAIRRVCRRSARCCPPRPCMTGN